MRVSLLELGHTYLMKSGRKRTVVWWGDTTLGWQDSEPEWGGGTCTCHCFCAAAVGPIDDVLPTSCGVSGGGLQGGEDALNPPHNGTRAA